MSLKRDIQFLSRHLPNRPTFVTCPYSSTFLIKGLCTRTLTHGFAETLNTRTVFVLKLVLVLVFAALCSHPYSGFCSHTTSLNNYNFRPTLFSWWVPLSFNTKDECWHLQSQKKQSDVLSRVLWPAWSNKHRLIMVFATKLLFSWSN